MGIMKHTSQKRSQCLKKKLYNLRVEAVLKSTEISAITLMYYPPTEVSSDSNKVEEKEKDLYNEEVDSDPFGLDKLFAELDDSYKFSLKV